MTARFSVLASGSGGNATFLQVGSVGLLIDVGLGSRTLSERLGQVGAYWTQIRAVLLTHTHSDHWRETSLTHLVRRRIPLYCHADHLPRLLTSTRAADDLRRAGLIREFRPGVEFGPLPDLVCRAVEVSHDSRPTFGFRFDGSPTLFGPGWSFGYVSDLGRWNEELIQEMDNVDVLAIEFNHDIRMERTSGRSRSHIERVLSDVGHLSNEQAADLLDRHLQRTPHRLRHLVQLHLSQDCNLPALAVDAARRVLNRHGSTAQIHTAEQYRPLAAVSLDGGKPRPAPTQPRVAAPKRNRIPHPVLPGFEPEAPA